MKHILYIAAFLSAALAVGTAATITGSPQDSCRTRSDEILAALQKGDYVAATVHFDARVHAGLSAEKLEQVWSKLLPAQAGAFKRAATTAMTTQADGALAETPLEFTNAWLNLRVACNADGSVGGLFFAPGSAPDTAAVAPALTPGAPASHDQIIDQQLDVVSPLGLLPGTLTLPAGDGPFPAVLLVAGSGPNDRDETVGPNKPFADIAHGLAATRIASFRYDKRTKVYGAKMAGAAIRIDDEVTDDAVTALKLLAQQPHIDCGRVFVLGHSLGAFMAPRIATRDAHIAGAILLAAPAAFDLDTVVRQTRYLAGVQHATPQQTDAALAPILAARDAIAHADPAHSPAGEFFRAPASYWLSLRDYHPIAVAQALKQPLLILQGGSDYQVTPDDDFAQWQTAFAHDPHVTLKEYPGLSHLFMPAGNPPSPADYTRVGHVDPRVIADIAQWIASTTHGDVH